MGSRTCEDDDDDVEGKEEAVQHPPLPPAPQRWWVEEPGGAWWRPETLRSESSAMSRVSPSARRTDTDRNHQSGHRVVFTFRTLHSISHSSVGRHRMYT